MKLKRGEVWTVSGGLDYAGKPRPAVILNNDDYLDNESATICMFTTDTSKTQVARPLIDPDGNNGIRDQSYLMVDKITTVPSNKMGRRVGNLGEADMVELNRAIIDFLGLKNFSAHP